MFSQPVRDVMEREKLLLTSPETSVKQAAKLMSRRKVGAIMIVKDERLIGIFTERDVVNRVVAQDRDVQTTQVADVMTTAPHTVHPGKSFGCALLTMYENGFRHLPVIEDERVIGIVSARNALDPGLEQFVVESQRRQQILLERI